MYARALYVSLLYCSIASVHPLPRRTTVRSIGHCTRRGSAACTGLVSRHKLFNDPAKPYPLFSLLPFPHAFVPAQLSRQHQSRHHGGPSRIIRPSAGRP